MVKPIRNKAQYEETLARVYSLMQKSIKPESKESDELEILSILIRIYEAEHYAVPKPSPPAA
jgi:HTH-type transcriptional regulator/antitoxin HigA